MEVEQLQQLVEAERAGAARLRELKCQMAKRKREAETRALVADTLQEQLQLTRKRCRVLRAQVQSAQVKMNLASESEPDSESVTEITSTILLTLDPPARA
mmetsp:Transcript_48590/g.120487  ORF Transcript_48590/g.120487 Transcript_48590/m.120487 type:complete len:100 (-) Transcript_48590:192-491(-)